VLVDVDVVVADDVVVVELADAVDGEAWGPRTPRPSGAAVLTPLLLSGTVHICDGGVVGNAAVVGVVKVVDVIGVAVVACVVVHLLVLICGFCSVHVASMSEQKVA